MLDDGGERLDPVAAVEVVDIADHLVGGGVDVAADDAGAAALVRKARDVALEFRDVVHRALHAGLDGLAERPVFLAAPRAPVVVGAVEVEQHLVAPVAEVREEDEIARDGVEHVAVQHQIAAAVRRLVQVLLDDGEVLEVEREHLAEHVVVVAAQVDHLRVAFFHVFEDDADETRVGVVPLAAAHELPAVNDVAVEDELLAADVAEKMRDLADLAVGGAEVHVGEDDGADAELWAGQQPTIKPINQPSHQRPALHS